MSKKPRRGWFGRGAPWNSLPAPRCRRSKLQTIILPRSSASPPAPPDELLAYELTVQLPATKWQNNWIRITQNRNLKNAKLPILSKSNETKLAMESNIWCRIKRKSLSRPPHHPTRTPREGWAFSSAPYNNQRPRREKKEIISAKKGIRKATAAVQPFPYDWLQSWPQDWFYVVQLAGKPSGQPAA